MLQAMCKCVICHLEVTSMYESVGTSKHLFSSLGLFNWYLIQPWKVAASHCLGNWELLTYPFLLLHWTVNNSWSGWLVVSEPHQRVIQKSWHRLSADASIFTWLFYSFAEPFSVTSNAGGVSGRKYVQPGVVIGEGFSKIWRSAERMFFHPWITGMIRATKLHWCCRIADCHQQLLSTVAKRFQRF